MGEPSFLTELKRRNVIRMAGLYLVGAWLLVQVASTLFPAFHVPDWALRALVIVLALDFLPALVFAWVYELTPEGLMREVRVEGNAEFADALGFVFRHLRWDVEEDLSRLIGDIAAHRLVDAGRRFGVEGRDALERASGNLIEFLTEERPVLVARAALPGFATDIAALRDAVGRLDKRVARIERAAAGR